MDRNNANGFRYFTNSLARILRLDERTADELAELIDDRIRELGDERYTERPDPWRY